MPVAPQGEVKGRPGAVCLSGAGREGAGEAQGESRAQTRWGAPAQSGGSEVPVRSSRKLRSVQRPAWHGPEGNWCRAAAAVATASPLRNVRPQTQTVGSRCRVPPATASTREGCHTQRPRATPTTLHLTHRECTLRPARMGEGRWSWPPTRALWRQCAALWCQRAARTHRTLPEPTAEVSQGRQARHPWRRESWSLSGCHGAGDGGQNSRAGVTSVVKAFELFQISTGQPASRGEQLLP